MIRLLAGVLVVACFSVACGGAPGESGLRDSFAQQLAANKFVSGFQQNGDELTFKGPGPDGTPANWRVQIDSARIDEPSNERQPYKGTITSSWFVNGEEIRITGADSNLPIELTSNGLSQECWAFWDATAKTWGWE